MSLDWTVANDLRLFGESGGPTLSEDYEVSRVSVLVKQGFSPGLEGFIELPVMARGGGMLDPIIDWWHTNVLHWIDPLREETARGRSEIAMPDGTRFGSAGGLGDVSLGLSGSLKQGLVWTIAVKLPTGNASALLGSGGYDAGFDVQVSKPWGKRWNWGAQAGAIYQGVSSVMPEARRWVHQGALWLVWSPNAKDRWVLQWQSEASALRSGLPASDAAHRLVTVGYRRMMAGNRSLEVFLSEDRDLPNGKVPEISNVGPDFTIGVRLSWRG